MLVSVALIIGLLFGFLLAWVIAEARHRPVAQQAALTAEQLRAAEIKLAELAGEQSGGEQRARDAERQAVEALRELAVAKQRLVDLNESYASRLQSSQQLQQALEAMLPKVADSVLTTRVEQLESTARKEWQLVEQQTVAQVQQNNAQLKTAIEAMRQQVSEYQQRLQAMEVERAKANERVEQQVQEVALAGRVLSQEARSLREALQTGAGVRGRWGENVLRNILSACGLNEHVDYTLQSTLSDGEARYRPDAIIHLPSGRKLIIDSKASMDEFFKGLEAAEEERQRASYKDLARTLRRRADELASKNYAANLEAAVPCVIMFVPSEAAFRAALDADAELYAYGQDKRPTIVLASPATIFPIIALIAQGWQQEAANRQAEALHAEVQLFAQRVTVFVEHLNKAGNSLNSAVEHFNRASNSFRSRLSPQLEKLRGMGIHVEESEPLVVAARALANGEVAGEAARRTRALAAEAPAGQPAAESEDEA